jgi:glycosyltransferase involved in cell wall biosynthesis
MLSRNILLVTFPVDLGNRTLEANQHDIFRNDMDFFRFAEKHAYDIDSKSVGSQKSLIYRFQSAFALRRIIRKYTKEGKTILFNGLSPALFSYGVWKPEQTAIVFDWTRSLYTSVLGKPIKKNWVFKLHRKVLHSCPKFLCWTDAVMENLIEIYGVEKSSLFKVSAPFLVEKMDIPPRPTPEMPRVLFVGGDLKRKGGDVLIEGWQSFLADKCTLTMMSNDPAANIEGVRFLPGIKYGSNIHKVIFKEHDILILPTRIDAYPQVIGEAAAAGLAVITTKYALGAKEVIIDGITGFIADTPEESILRLKDLLNNPALINDFKKKGYQLMHQKFSKDLIRQGYLDVLNGKIQKNHSLYT